MSDDSWRDTYDHWKTTDPADEELGPEPCPKCGGEGAINGEWCECQQIEDRE